MNWTDLNRTEQLDAIDQASYTAPQLLFKHSTRCNISADAYAVLDAAPATAYYLDLLAYRALSDEIARRYGVLHKSPQVLIIYRGQCIYHESHWRIQTEPIMQQLQNV